MRRPLLAAALLLPLGVAAAIAVAPTGRVVDLDNYNAADTTSYINAAQCAGGPLDLQWAIVGSGTGTDTHRIIASSHAPPTTGDGANFCPDNAPTASPPVFSEQVDSVPWTANIQGKEINGKTVADTAHVACDSSGEGKVLYVCAHLLASDGTTRKGYASGKFQVQVAAPNTPTITDVGPASETSLYVAWNPPSGGITVDHYQAKATAGTEERWSGLTEGTNATISDLTEGTTYSVVVYAFSLGGNPSQPSGAMDGVPGPVLDFWETYLAAGGADDGGCATGGAGPLALLGVAALLRLRRRT